MVDVIASSLCNVFDKSIRLGKFPTEWKTANICPIPKKENKQHAENYGQISLLSVVSKVMERCVFNGIKERVHQSIHACQHGFLSGRSCVSQLVEVVDTIGLHLDRGQIDTILLDMSKAFDKVSHWKLIAKLTHYDFCGNLLRWFTSYLTNRKQRVTVPWGSSECRSVTSGVPQGSILGPMLFLLFANGFPGIVKSSCVAAFAEDINVFKAIKSQNNVTELHQDLHTISNWADTTNMVFISTKIKVMRNPIESTCTLCGSTLERTNCEKDLSVWICDNLMWS